MHGQRMRYLSIVFALALMAIGGGIVAIIASQPTRHVPATPAAAVSPAPAAHASPGLTTAALATDLPAPVETPADAPTVQPTDAPTVQPTEQPTQPPVAPGATPDLSPEPAPALEPSPVPPTATPGGPTREVAFSGVGLDSDQPIEDQATSPRFVTLTAEGPGDIRAHLAGVTGRVRACIWRGDADSPTNASCQVMRRGDLEQRIEGGGPQTWTLSFIGTQGNVSPTMDLRLTYPTNNAGLRLEGFRFQGSDIENYNGFSVELRVGATGPITVSANLDDGEGGSHPYRLVIQEVSGGPAQPFIAEKSGFAVSESTQGIAERSYRITLENREGVSDAAIMLSAELDWP